MSIKLAENLVNQFTFDKIEHFGDKSYIDCLQLSKKIDKNTAKISKN